jgi:hypothetical protein
MADIDNSGKHSHINYQTNSRSCKRERQPYSLTSFLSNPLQLSPCNPRRGYGSSATITKTSQSRRPITTLEYFRISLE